MNNYLKAAVLGVALAGGVAHADTIDFSYLFSDGLSLAGTMSGTLNGNYVTGISNINVSFNGVAYNGPLSIGTFNATSGTYDFSSGAAAVSANASLNNFIIADSSDPLGANATNEFYFVNGTTPSGAGTQEVVAANSNVLTNNTDIANTALGYAPGVWTLTDATVPVPLPAALPMLLSGLGLFGAVRRRLPRSLSLA